MAWIQKKKEVKIRRSFAPLAGAVLFSVTLFVLILGSASFIARNDEVKGSFSVLAQDRAQIALNKIALQAMKRQAQVLAGPCVKEAIRLDPAAASVVRVDVFVHSLNGVLFLQEIKANGFSSPYFQKCLTQLLMPKTGTHITEYGEPAQGVAFAITGKTSFQMNVSQKEK